MMTFAPDSRAANAAQQAALPAPTTITSGFPKSVVLMAFLSGFGIQDTRFRVGSAVQGVTHGSRATDHELRLSGQCRVLGGAEARRGSASLTAPAGAGEAWCATMR